MNKDIVTGVAEMSGIGGNSDKSAVYIIILTEGGCSMKKLSLVAVAVCLFVGSSFAEWGKFGVIEDGSAEAKFGIYGGGGMELYIHYGLMDKLELYSTAGTGVSNYTLGAKYMFIPLLGGFLDFDLPTMNGILGNHDFGLTGGINVTKDFTETLSFGSVVKLSVDLADPDAILGLTAGVEFDYMFSSNIGAWLGIDFVIDNLSDDIDAMESLQPGIGFFFTKDALTVGTMLNLIKFNHPKANGEEFVGISGGVEVCVKF